MREWTIYIEGRSFRISGFHLWIIAVLMFIGLSYSSISIARFAKTKKKKAIAAKLMEKNLIIKERLMELKEEIGQFQQHLDNVVTLDKKARIAWGLESIDEDIRALGTGGRASDNPGIDPLVKDIKMAIESARNVLDFEKTSLSDISLGIERRRNLLEHTPSVWPTTGYVSSGFGWRRHPVYRKREFHRGIDISTLIGRPILAPASGIASFIGRRGGYGLTLEIDHGFGYRTVYGHLHKVNIHLYEQVRRGQVIAYVGNSGISTGPHLHYEVKVLGKSVNPKKYIINSKVSY